MGRSKKTVIVFRPGITVMEVLVSMVVALIGVLGIMIMIPFSVGQVQTAFNYETANRLGRNGANEFKIKGFDNTARWMRSMGPVGGATVRSYCIDPMGVAARDMVGQPSGYFPFVHPALVTAIELSTASSYPNSHPSADKGILIERCTLLANVGPPLAAMGNELARIHFSWRHDLQTQSPTRNDIFSAPQYPTIDLAPPQQIFDVNSVGAPMRRQALGDLSYTVVSLPTEVTASPFFYPVLPDSPEVGNVDLVPGFRNFFLVYKQRPMPLNGTLATDRVPYDRIYEVIHPLHGLAGSPNWNNAFRISVSGGEIVLRDPTLNPDLQTTHLYSTQRQEIHRGDWMALTNVTFNVARQRFFQQVDFYLVLDVATAFDPRVNENVLRVTLQGPDFDFLLATMDGGFDPTIDPSLFNNYAARVVQLGPGVQVVPSKTYAIHLPDVWAVIERSYQ